MVTVPSGSSLNTFSIFSHAGLSEISRCSCGSVASRVGGVKWGCVTEMFDRPSGPCCVWISRRKRRG